MIPLSEDRGILTSVCTLPLSFESDSQRSELELESEPVDAVSPALPCIVYVLPVLVGPYTKMVQFYPFRKARTNAGPLHSVKTRA